METKPGTSSPPAESQTEIAQRSTGNVARIVNLVVGDILVFLIFAFIGMKSHGEDVTVPSLLATAAPFAGAWFVISPFVGAYRRQLDANPGMMVRRTVLAWIASWPLALIIRGLIEGHVPPISFALITLFTNMLLLLLWRWSYALTKRNRLHR